MSYIAKNGRLYTSGASEALTLLDDKFSVNKSYSKGDSCIYNDYLWKFTSDKPAGEWDSSVVEQCRIMDFVDDANGRLTQVQNQIVPTASIEIGNTASKAYSVDDFLVKDGILYKVTKAITQGDALTVGTNIVMTTVGGELSEIKPSSKNYNSYGTAIEVTNGNSYTVPYDGILFAKCGSGNTNFVYFSIDDVFPTGLTLSGTTSSTSMTVPIFKGQVVSISEQRGVGKLYFIPFTKTSN